MSATNPVPSQKEYLKKYLSGEDVKKKKKKKISSNTIKRSQIIDDDIDLKSMRPLDQDEVDLYQMDEDAPQIAGIIDDRPPEIKSKEYYNPKRWKVFGGDDGVNIVDSLDGKNTSSIPQENSELKQGSSKRDNTKSFDSRRTDKPDKFKRSHSSDSDRSLSRKSKDNISLEVSSKRKESKKHISSDSDQSPSRPHNRKKDKYVSLPRKDSRGKSSKHNDKYDSDHSLSRKSKRNNERNKSDSDASPSRRDSRESTPNRYDSDASPPRKSQVKSRNHDSDTDSSPPRRDSRRRSPKRRDRHDSDNSPPRKSNKRKSDSDASPPRRDSRKKSPKRQDKYDSDNSPPRKSNKKNSDSDASPPRREPRRKSPKRQDKYDSDNSPPRINKSNNKKSDSNASPPRRDPRGKLPMHRDRYDSDSSPPRKSKYSKRSPKGFDSDASPPRKSYKKNYDSDPSPPRKGSRKHSPNRFDKSTSNKEIPTRLSRKDLVDGKTYKKRFSDSDDSPPRKRRISDSFSNTSSPRKKPFNDGPKKKTLYKPNDSSSDESNSRKKKMKTTLDGKQAGLQDAKQLKKELSDLRMKEDLIFSKMEASVSGVGAAAVKRDRKTGQVRDLEKEKEAQKEKAAKDSVLKEKYHKWGKGLKQMEDAEERMADMMKEMNKPLARYRDDKDLDDYLKAQDREGDPMLDYVKRKQSEATSLAGVKPIYKGAFNPNRFKIRPGHRWDGVVRSNGYEKEWFTHQNARKARDDEAYKWSTSDM